MKKFIVAVVMLAVFASAASSEIIGTFNLNVDGRVKNTVFAGVFDAGIAAGNNSLKFYDSLMLMQLALDKGEIGALS